MKFDFKKVLNLNYTDGQILSMANSLTAGIISIHLVSSAIIVNILMDDISNISLFIWFFMQIIVLTIRQYTCKKLKFHLSNNDENKLFFYFKAYLLLIFISGSLWGYILSIGIINEPESLAFFLITLLFALSSASILTLGTVFLAVLLFNISLILPTLFAFLYSSSNQLYFLEGILLLTFMFVTLKTSYKRQKLSYEYEQSLSLMKQYEKITNKCTIISKTDTKGIITHANKNFCQIAGYNQEELIGQNHNIIRHPDMPQSAFEDIWNTIKNEKKSWNGIIKNRAKNGESYYASTTISPILDRNNNITEYIALCHDISTIMSDKKQLLDYLESNKLSVIIMIQIEDYDTVEKFYDSATVEEIEKSFGRALLHLLPSDCDFQRVYHLENGLFALAKDRRTYSKSQRQIESMLREFLVNVKAYVVKLDKIEYDISAICSYTYGVLQIFEDAKIGIEKAIEKKQDIIYADGLSNIEYAIALRNIETLRVLKVALDDKKVISYFQPIINNETRKVEKYESLVRLINEKNEVVSPYHFLEIAKKGRYYEQVTKIVLENTFIRLGDTDKDISINVSALDIELEDIQKLIFELLDKHKKDANRIVFELLESEDVKDFATVLKFIKKVKIYGVKIAIDDFGTGYSNFKRLLQYEPDLLKIDGSLIKDIQTNKLSRNIVETIVLFAQKQKIKTIAEFVENEEIYNCVKEMGIDYSQGYAFGRPEELMKD